MQLKLELIYCAVWNYTGRAIREMADILQDKELERQIETFDLVPSEGGRFEFSVNGELVFSKLKTFRHAEEGELKKALKQYLASQ